MIWSFLYYPRRTLQRRACPACFLILFQLNTYRSLQHTFCYSAGVIDYQAVIESFHDGLSLLETVSGERLSVGLLEFGHWRAQAVAFYDDILINVGRMWSDKVVGHFFGPFRTRLSDPILH